MPEDLGTLIQRLLARGERIVIIGAGEPMVLLPWGEYERLTALGPAITVGQSGPHLEPIDLPAGPLPDDDQYFPEPL